MNRRVQAKVSGEVGSNYQVGGSSASGTRSSEHHSNLNGAGGAASVGKGMELELAE